MAPRAQMNRDVEPLDGFESSILSVLAQLPDDPAMRRRREELRNRLSGEARGIANALMGEPASRSERLAAEALTRWAKPGA